MIAFDKLSVLVPAFIAPSAKSNRRRFLRLVSTMAVVRVELVCMRCFLQADHHLQTHVLNASPIYASPLNLILLNIISILTVFPVVQRFL